MIYKKYRLVLIVMLALSFFAGCAHQADNQPAGSKDEKKKIKIGFSMDSLVQERWIRDRDIFVARAGELGAEVIVQNASGDGAEQERQAQYLLEQGIDVLVIIPHDADKAASIVHNAKSRGVKVISYDRLVKNAATDLYISFDNIKVGELMAGAMVKKVPQGSYMIVNGSKLDNNSYMFNQGFKNILNAYIDDSRIQLVDEEWVKEWRYEDSYNFVESALKEGKKIDAIIAANDTLAGAAVDALSEMRLAGKVPVVGHDADLDGCQRVVEGTQLATIYKPIDKIARSAAEFAVNMAQGGMIEADDMIFDGKTTVPYYKIEPILVTKDNMVQVIIGDDFHRLEEVYMNVPKSQWPKVQ